MTDPNAINQAKNSFNQSIESIFQDKSKFYPIAAYIQNLIKRYPITKSFDVAEVFNEAYLRGIEYIERTGKEINNSEAFIKRVSLRIIQENQRKQKKYKGIDPNSCQDIISTDEFINNLFSEGFSQAQIQSLKTELKKLKAQDLTLILSSVVEEKPTKEIAQLLSASGKQISNAAVRKRKSRILEKLRQELT